MCIRTPLLCCVTMCVFISQVLTVRLERKPMINRLVQEKDNLEDELRLQSTDIESPTEVDNTIMNSKGENVSEQLEGVSDVKLDEDDIYDLTVGDVIRDVLFTLREHPEIVKELIESERRKLLEKMSSGLTDVKAESELEAESGQVSSYRATTSAEDTALAFELPPEQMTFIPKHFENKVGHLEESPSPVVTGRERVGGLIQRKNDQSVESNVPDVPLLHLLPKEGGGEDPMFEYESKQKTVSADEIAAYRDDVKSNDSYHMQKKEDPGRGVDNSAMSETRNIENDKKLAYINPVSFFPALFLSKQANRHSDKMQSAPHAQDTPAEIDKIEKKYSGQFFTSEKADIADAQNGEVDMSAKLGIDESVSKDKQETTNPVSSSENLENKAVSMNILDDKAEMELFSLLQKVASKQKGKMRRESLM